ncbi:MAG: TIGR03790 family protein [Polyangiaceae bacterium]
MVLERSWPLLSLALMMMVSCGDDDPSGAGGVGGDGGAATTGGAGPGGDGGQGGGDVEPTMLFEPLGLSPDQLAVVINDQDPISVAVGAAYQQARSIPAENVHTLSFATDAVLPEADFAPLKAALDAALGPEIQALALTWATPYRVGCMSVTSAFALGFSDVYCNTTGGACGPTAPVDYFDSSSSAPFTDHGIRPAMTLAAATIADGEALIDRGVASDASFPTGNGYFVRTTDTARSVRWPSFVSTVGAFDHLLGLDVTYVDNADGSGSNVIEDTTGILFYFTGLANVPGIESNEYIPGAAADHLTSFGGRMPDAGGQMSVLRWLEAGATGSYGTTVEPCNYTEKFPDTSVMLPHYFRGETLIEAYWKSVQWPGEGVFVGEPLARPWGSSFTVDGDTLTLTTTSLVPGSTYQIVSGPTPDGPWTPVIEPITTDAYGFTELSVLDATEPY